MTKMAKISQKRYPIYDQNSCITIPFEAAHTYIGYKTKLIARLVLQQKGKIYWPIFQLAELVFFRAST